MRTAARYVPLCVKGRGKNGAKMHFYMLARLICWPRMRTPADRPREIRAKRYARCFAVAARPFYGAHDAARYCRLRLRRKSARYQCRRYFAVAADLPPRARARKYGAGARTITRVAKCAVQTQRRDASTPHARRRACAVKDKRTSVDATIFTASVRKHLFTPRAV